MKKYFYTDPLAAAWMVKNFGMKLQSINNGPVQFSMDEESEIPKYEMIGEMEDKYGWEVINKAYIHPDSVHLLEPQKGDRLLWRGYGRTEWKYEEAYTHTTMKGWEFLILQRNDKAFMWPESEEV